MVGTSRICFAFRLSSCSFFLIFCFSFLLIGSTIRETKIGCEHQFVSLFFLSLLKYPKKNEKEREMRCTWIKRNCDNTIEIGRFIKFETV